MNDSTHVSRRRIGVFYALTVVAAIAGFVWIRAHGSTLQAPVSAPASSSHAASAGQGETVFHVLLALVAVIIAGRVVGRIFYFVGQPPVIGEVLAGIMLGPSLLGWIAPNVWAFVLPQEIVPYLDVIAQLAIVLYMFLVGLELDASALRKKGHAAVAVSHASIIAPFLLGSALALLLYPRLSSQDVPFTVFALFLGVSLSVTAFPVLARILTDRKIHKTPLGIVALTCAAVGDVTAWCMLAFVVGVAKAQVLEAVVVVGCTLAYVAFMLVVVRPCLRFVPWLHAQELTQGRLAVVLILVLLSALATDWIGVHAVFGAFLLGAVIPHNSMIARELPRQLNDLLAVLLLPAFFALTGMRTQIGLVSGLENWLLCGLIIVVATVGKFGGTLGASRLAGMGWRDSAALGILMNTRGLMELIVLNIGLDMGVISPTLFAMLVIMALVTTVATTPILHWIRRPEPASRSCQLSGVTEKLSVVGCQLSVAEPGVRSSFPTDH